MCGKYNKKIEKLKKNKLGIERCWEFNPITGEIITESSNLYLICKCGNIIKDLDERFKDGRKTTPKNKICNITVVCQRCKCNHRFFGLTAIQLEKFRNETKFLVK